MLVENSQKTGKNGENANFKKVVENSGEKLDKFASASKNTGKLAENVVENDKNEGKNDKKWSKASKILLVLGIFGLLSGGGMAAAAVLTPEEKLPDLTFPMVPSVKSTNNIYSKLTGLELKDASEVNAPTYCIQTPNGTDGGRPQAGLNEAGVVFEAIAEAGITRFAAIYQNPSSAVIGPIRSLRIYYLEWDTPFDCTIVHAGGAPDALAAVSRGYKDLSENYSYMYRGSRGERRWNNLFTTSSYLKQVAADRGWNTSEINGFSRLTPSESLISRVDDLSVNSLVITEPANGNTSELVAKVSDIRVNFGGWATFNVRYHYDVASNTYLRSYETGVAANVYSCPSEDLGERNPEDVCSLVQMAPSVVVAMTVQEKRAAYDGYHEDITTVGSGDVRIFQNGTVLSGSWVKSSVNEQIKFYDDSGVEIKLAPGQTVVEAVPAYGSVEY